MPLHPHLLIPTPEGKGGGRGGESIRIQNSPGAKNDVKIEGASARALRVYEVMNGIHSDLS